MLRHACALPQVVCALGAAESKLATCWDKCEPGGNSPNATPLSCRWCALWAPLRASWAMCWLLAASTARAPPAWWRCAVHDVQQSWQAGFIRCSVPCRICSCMLPLTTAFCPRLPPLPLPQAANAAGVQQFVLVTSLGTGKIGFPAGERCYSHSPAWIVSLHVG